MRQGQKSKKDTKEIARWVEAKEKRQEKSRKRRVNDSFYLFVSSCIVGVANKEIERDEKQDVKKEPEERSKNKERTKK